MCKRKNKSKLRKLISIFVVLVILVIVPASSFASTGGVFLQFLIDKSNNNYVVSPEEPFSGFFNNRAVESNIFSFDKFFGACGDDTTNLAEDPGACFRLDTDFHFSDKEDQMTGFNTFARMEGYYKQEGGSLRHVSNNEDYIKWELDDLQGSRADFLPLSFPSVNRRSKTVSSREIDHAIKIGNILTTNLNGLLLYINENKRYINEKELANQSIAIRPTSRGYTIINSGDAGYLLLYGMPENHDYAGNNALNNFFTKNSAYDINNNLLVYVIKHNQGTLDYNNQNTINEIIQGNTENSNLPQFVWATAKGYIKIEGMPGSLIFTDENNEEFSSARSEDVPWITIHHASMFANFALKEDGLHFEAKGFAEDGNVVVRMLAGSLGSVIVGLQTLLRLENPYDLVFNRGIRGTSAYNYGAMPSPWWESVLAFHIIFQSIAWFIIIVGLIKTLILLNLSTINPGKRMHVYKTLERFVLAGFLLVLIMPVVQFLLSMNNSVVQIFATQVDPLANKPPVVGTLAGVILQFAYLGITIYINFVYIMRSIMIGLLIVSAPFFIASMIYSERSPLFSTWIKELIANIFMQSIHAFALAFLTGLVLFGGGGLAQLVVAYSIIPITEVFNNLIFQGAGAATKLGKGAAAKGTNLVKGLTGAAAGAAGGYIAGKVGAGDSPGQGAGQGQSGKEQPTMSGSIGKAATEKSSSIAGDAKETGNEPKQKRGKMFAAGAMSAIGGASFAAGAVASSVGSATDMAMSDLTDNPDYARHAGKSMFGIAQNTGKATATGASAVGVPSGIEKVKEKLKSPSSLKNESMNAFSNAIKGNSYAPIRTKTEGDDVIETYAPAGTMGMDSRRNITQNLSKSEVEAISNNSNHPQSSFLKSLSKDGADLKEIGKSTGVEAKRTGDGGVSLLFTEDYRRINNIKEMSLTDNNKVNIRHKKGTGYKFGSGEVNFPRRKEQDQGYPRKDNTNDEQSSVDD